MPIFRLILGRWLLINGGSSGFGLVGLLGLLPDMPSLTLGQIPNWQMSAFALPIDFPTIDLGDFATFFSNPFGTINTHLGKLLSNPTWAYPALRWLTGTLYGILPDLSLPDMGAGGGALPSLDAFPIRGSGSYDDPWSITLPDSVSVPGELLLWLDPDGPNTGGFVSSTLTTLLPPALQDLSAIDRNTVSSDQIVNIMNVLRQVDDDLLRLLDSVDAVQFTDALQELNNFIVNSDGFVPLDLQRPLEATTTWTAPQANNDTLPVASHMKQLDNVAIQAEIKTQVDAISNTASVLLLSAPWAGAEGWEGVLGEFGQGLANTPHVDFRVAGADPAVVSVQNVTTATRCYTATINPFNLDPLAPTDELPITAPLAQSSMVAQVSRLVDHIRTLNNEPVIIVAHSLSGVVARATSIRDGNDSRITGVITIGTPHLSSAPAWAIGGVSVDDLVSLLNTLSAGNLPDIDFKSALQALYDMMTDTLDLPRFPIHMYTLGDLPLDLPDSVAGRFLATRLTQSTSLYAVLMDWLEQRVTNLLGTFDARPAVTHLGFGFRHQGTSSDALDQDVTATTSLRLDLARVPITPDNVDTSSLAQLPRLHIMTNIRRNGGWLVGSAVDSIRLRRAELGFQITHDTLQPIVNLYDTSIDGVRLQSAVLEQLPSGGFTAPATMTELLNVMMAHLTQGGIIPSQQADDLFALLTYLEITMDVGTGFGVNPDGWQALLDNPSLYLSQIVNKSTMNWQAFIAGIETIMGDAFGRWAKLLIAQADDTPLETALRECLATLSLAESASKQYVLKVQEIIGMLLLDKDALVARLEAVFNNPMTRTSLLQKLRNLLGLNDAGLTAINETVFDLFNLQITSTGQVTLSLITPLTIATDISLDFDCDINLETTEMDVALVVRYTRLMTGVGFELMYRGGVADYTLALRWDIPDLPAPYEPLHLIPPEPNLDTRLYLILKRFIISAMTSQIIEDKVFTTIPEAIDLFAQLGLAHRSVANADWKVRGLDGLFNHPKNWLLSQPALGTANEQLAINKLADLINDLADVAGVRNGANISLPYGVQVNLVNAGNRLDIKLGMLPPLALANSAEIASEFTLSIRSNLQISTEADLAVLIDLPNTAGWNTLLVESAYANEDFTFALGNNDDIQIQLYPFNGFDASLLANVVADATFQLLPLLLEAMTNSMGDSAGILPTIADNLNTVRLGLGLTTLNDFNDLLDNPTIWLSKQLRESTTELFTALSNLMNNSVWANLSIIDNEFKYALSISPTSSLIMSIAIVDDNLNLSVSADELVVGPSNHQLSIIIGVPLNGGAVTFNIMHESGISDSMIRVGEVSIMPSITLNMTQNTPTPTIVIDPMGLQDIDFLLQVSPTIELVHTEPLSKIITLLTKTILLPLLAEILIDSGSVNGWLSSKIPNTVPEQEYGAIFVAAGLLDNDDAQYNLKPFNEIPTEGEAFLTNLLGAILHVIGDVTLLSFGAVGGGVSVEKNNQRLGIRLNLPRITILDDPEIVLLIGSPDADASETAWIEDASDGDATLMALNPGVTLWIAEFDSTDFTFKPALSIVNFGINVSGKADQALFNIEGFKLDGVEARIIINIDDLTELNITTGFVADLKQLGLPLELFAGEGSVAQNLLSSGDDSDRPGDKAPINPAFNVSSGYISKFYIDFDGATEVWIPIQSGFGGVYIHQIGLNWTKDESKSEVRMLVDGNVLLSGLTIEFDDLYLGYNFSAKKNRIAFGLRGLGVSYISDSVKISGALLKEKDTGGYAGLVLVEAAGRTFAALGAYGQVEDNPSLFVFVVVSTPLGGPPYFFVLGLAGGFGYNRNLIAPSIEEVNTFPLVSVATGGSNISKPLSMLTELGQDVPPMVGSYWLAAGVRFSSFALVNSFALLYVLLNEGFEIGLLGIASMQLPQDKPLVSIEMALKVRFSTSDGVFSVEAQLTNNSWLLDVSCRLTGGFAFYMWFSGIHKGDFVITLGGYHPRFAKPDHFPVVPRLGFNWRYNTKVVIKGEAYFALTNSAVMAGGLLEASYRSGNLKAWFTVETNFLIQWKPFYYDVDFSISVGASYRASIKILGKRISKTFKVEIGAGLTIWGPKFSAIATIDWTVISFKIPFGANASKPSLVDWDEFRTDFLPETIYTVEIARGLMEVEKPPHILLRPEFILRTETGFAANMVQVGGIDAPNELMIDGNKLSLSIEDLDVAPMAKSLTESIHKFDIRDENGQSVFKGIAENSIKYAEINYVDENGQAGAKTVNHLIEIGYSTKDNEVIRFQIIRDFLPGAIWDTDVTDIKLKKVTVPAIVGMNVIVAVNEDDLQSNHATDQIDVKQKDLGLYIHPLPFHKEIPDRLDLEEMVNVADYIEQIPQIENNADVLLNTAQYILNSPEWDARRQKVIQSLQASGAVVDIPTADIASTYTATRRSAPPQIVSLYEGMSADVDENAEFEAYKQPIPQPIVLRTRRPLLTAIMQQRAEPTRAAIPARRTSVLTVEDHQRIPRIAIDSLRNKTLAGSQLQRIPHPQAPSPTRMPTRGNVYIHDLSLTSEKSQEFIALQERSVFKANAINASRLRLINTFHAEAVSNNVPGVRLRAGAAQVWDVPSREFIGDMPEIVFAGDQALRITAINRVGDLLDDSELFGTGRYDLPDSTAQVIVMGLGVPALVNENLVPAMGQITLNEATDPVAITGWQSCNQLLKVSHSTVLGRGSVVKVGSSLISRRKHQQVKQALITGAKMSYQQETIETWLPASVNTVGILLQHQGASAEDITNALKIGVRGASLTEKPNLVIGGSLGILLYGVQDVVDSRGALRIATLLDAGWQLKGVIGMLGSQTYWTGALATQNLDTLIEDGPLTANGETRIAFILPQDEQPQGDEDDVIT